MGMAAPFPRCISCVHHQLKDRPIIKLIKSDGGIKIYERPIKVWQLMEEFPKHMVCRSDSFYIGQKTAALSQHERLQRGHNYFLLPSNFFQSALSFATFLRCRSTLPFDVEKTPTGGLRIRVSEEMLVDQGQKMMRVCDTPQLRKDYQLLVGRRHQWKPKLDTIAEKNKKTRQNKSILHI